MAALFSMLDEFHQSFVPSRTSSPWDSLLDTTGAAFAQLAGWIWLRSRQNPTALVLTSNPTGVEICHLADQLALGLLPQILNGSAGGIPNRG